MRKSSAFTSIKTPEEGKEKKRKKKSQWFSLAERYPLSEILSLKCFSPAMDISIQARPATSTG